MKGSEQNVVGDKKRLPGGQCSNLIKYVVAGNKTKKKLATLTQTTATKLP
jgi:hypothetical protein